MLFSTLSLRSQACKCWASGDWMIVDVGNWFGGKRPYHHTALISIAYSMREALQVLAEVGLQNAWSKHLRLHKDMWKGLSELGLEPFVEDEKDRLITVNTIKVGCWDASSHVALYLEQRMPWLPRNMAVHGSLGSSNFQL